jgi:enamine deaminase RidA (YjgF/YER057c/UK114 family)
MWPSASREQPRAVVRAAKPSSQAQDLIFVSAHSAAPDLQGSAAEQMAIALDRLASVLAADEAGLGDVVKVGLFYHRTLVDEEAILLQQLRSAFPE